MGSLIPRHHSLRDVASSGSIAASAQANSAGAKPVFVGFNGCYDWQFVNWYFIKFVGSNPFGFGGIDIKSYYMGKHRLAWRTTTSSQLPAEYRPDTAQTHNALDDAKAQASIFAKMLDAE